MLGAIKEMAEARPEEQLEHTAVLNYLTACSFLFEKGTLSHERVDGMSSQVLKNMDTGFEFFNTWKMHFSNAGIYITIIIILCNTCYFKKIM